VNHARGIPGYGPATLCGEGKPSGEALVQVDCPRCVDLLGDGAALVRRLEELEAAGTSFDREAPLRAGDA
jgi:hypothetical protein